MKPTQLAVVALVAAACTHTRHAEDPSTQQASQSAAEAPAEQQTAPGSRGLVAGGESKPNEIPVATSSQGLLKPGAEQKVKDKLGLEGEGGSMQEALQRFQRQHDLPATGILDHETAKALGLDPDEVFERAGPE
jgi:hypothetical protein